jgi:NodT family efflux transporter outer membrane factor (OMF) lipoprotein
VRNPLVTGKVRARELRSAGAATGLSVMCIVLSACSGFGGPEYQRPSAPEKTDWSLMTATPQRATEVIKLDWWTEFGDPYLNSLMSRATSNSLSIQLAAARLAEAGTLIGSAEALRLPSVTGTGGLQGTLQGGSGRRNATTAEGRASAGAGLSWELDLWGKLKKGISAQQAEYHASEADWRTVWLLTAADVSTTYFFIRQLDEQTQQQQQSLAAAEHILEVNTKQAAVGLKTATDVLTEQAEVDAIRTGLLELQRRRRLAENALATLIGTPAGELHVPIANLQNTVRIPTVPVGLPSDLLSRRPDILAAEYRVLSAHELYGQARLAQLPSIRLNIDGGTNNLLSSAIASWTFGIGPAIEIPIFNPNIQARIKTAAASTKTAEQEYRFTVINAFKEVEDALVSLANHKEQRRAISDRKEQLENVAQRVHHQLENGTVSQLQVLETQRTLLNASLDLLGNQQQILGDTITLFKALGGGWPPAGKIAETNDQVRPD